MSDPDATQFSYLDNVTNVSGVATTGTLLQFPQPPDFGAQFSERVLARLWQARNEERDQHRLDDLMVAWHTVSFAAQGIPIPFVQASYKVLGCHPDLVFRKVTAFRKAHLGSEYSRWFDDAGNARPSYLDVPDYDPTTGLQPLPRVNQSLEAVRVKWQKAPLRLVMKRTEIREGERVRYYVERLECGHSHTEFPDANPARRRRRCHACRDGIKANAQPMIVYQESATECVKEEAAKLRILFA